MKFTIKHQESYSRGELLLRCIFGWLYIFIPHMFLLYFVGIGVAFVYMISFWVTLFTGKYPEGMFNFVVKYMRWYYRVFARLLNLSDGNPAFGLNGEDENVILEVDHPKSVSRGLVLVRALFGWIYVIIPHMFVLCFRMIGTYFLMFFAWWSVLFTGNYPESWHKFNVGTLRWGLRINLYLYYMTDEYPPFSGKPDAELKGDVNQEVLDAPVE